MSTRKERVDQGRKVVATLSKSQWELGRLAQEEASAGTDTKNNGNDDKLAKFADDIGSTFNMLRECRRVHNAWSLATRVASASWSVHRELASVENRADWLAAHIAAGRKLTVDGVRLARNNRPTRYAPPEDREDREATPDEVLRAMRKNPDVVRAVARHDDTRLAVQKAANEHVRGSMPSERDYQQDRDDLEAAAARGSRSRGNDLALQSLRIAAGSLGNAARLKVTHGVDNVDEEAAILERIDRYRAVYGADVSLSVADREWAEANGVSL